MLLDGRGERRRRERRTKKKRRGREAKRQREEKNQARQAVRAERTAIESGLARFRLTTRRGNDAITGKTEDPRITARKEWDVVEIEKLIIVVELDRVRSHRDFSSSVRTPSIFRKWSVSLSPQAK